MRLFFFGVISVATALCSCGEKKAPIRASQFTKADSVTDVYLALQDSLLLTWNTLTSDDNRRLKAMHNLIHELMVSNADDREILVNFEKRLDQLTRIRYTEKSAFNVHVIEEYDSACEALMDEVIEEAQSKREFSYNSTLQKLVADIRASDERIHACRAQYDSVALFVNRFIEANKGHLREVDHSIVLDKKPLFTKVSE